MNWNILKKAIIGLIVSCVLVTSMPSFSIRSNAMGSVGGYIAYETAQAYLLYLSAYLGAHGRSGPRIAQDPDNTLVINGGSTVITEFINSFIDKLKLANTAQTTALLYALERAKNSGVFSLSSETDEFLMNYIDSITVNSEAVLGQSTERFDALPANQSITFSYDFIEVSHPETIYNYSVTLSVPYDTLPVLNLVYSGSYLQSFGLYLIPLSDSDYDVNGLSYTITNSNPGDYRPSSNSYPTGRLVSGSNYIDCWYFGCTFTNGYSYQPSSFNFPEVLTAVAAASSALYGIGRYFQNNGYYLNQQDLVSKQLYDTSNTDVLSVASEVDPYTGEVTPGFTYYMKDFSLFQQLIQQFNEGILSWSSLIKALGLSSVSSTATIAEKEQALDKVAYPDSTYDWLASTTWGDGITQSVTESVTETQTEEDVIANEVADTLYNGESPNDEDEEKSRGKGLLTALLIGLGIWSTPLLTSDDPTAGGTPGQNNDHPEYLPESISGINIASSLIDDIFDSAGGSNGYGLIYTIGASFVIFSVIIGASNYFGALFHGSDSKQNIKSSEKRSKGHKTNWNSNW